FGRRSLGLGCPHRRRVAIGPGRGRRRRVQQSGRDRGGGRRQHGDGAEAGEGGVALGLGLIQAGAGGGGFALGLNAAQQGLAPFLDQSQGRASVGHGQGQGFLGEGRPTLGRFGLGVDQRQSPGGVNHGHVAAQGGGARLG